MKKVYLEGIKWSMLEDELTLSGKFRWEESRGLFQGIILPST
jgi:hypothetical protein